MCMFLGKVRLRMLHVSPLQLFTIAASTPAQLVKSPWRSHFTVVPKSTSSSLASLWWSCSFLVKLIFSLFLPTKNCCVTIPLCCM